MLRVVSRYLFAYLRQFIEETKRAATDGCWQLKDIASSVAANNLNCGRQAATILFLDGGTLDIPARKATGNAYINFIECLIR